MFPLAQPTLLIKVRSLGIADQCMSIKHVRDDERPTTCHQNSWSHMHMSAR